MADSTIPVGEQRVKAAYLYQLSRFVRWPETAYQKAPNHFVIGVVGKDYLGTVLDKTFEGDRVGRRAYAIRRLGRGDDLTACQLLFVSRSEKDHVKEIIRRVSNKPVLLVGEMQGFAQMGGAINMILREKKVKLEINPKAAEARKLRISSKLLSVATVVQEDNKVKP